MRFETGSSSGIGPELEFGVKERIAGYSARREKLDSIARYPGDLFESDRQREELKEQILAVGLPVDNFKKLSRRRNKGGRENTLASWGKGSWNSGEFTVYELLDKQVPEKRLGTVVHENVHGASPFDRQNTFLYGSEEARAEAENAVRAVAVQSILTKKFLNGYHKWLYDQMKLQESGIAKTGITREIFDEETGSIAAELAMTNRAKLEQVEKAQHEKIDQLFDSGELLTNKKVNLLSRVVSEGDLNFAQVSGVDNILINLVDGVENYGQLMEHIDGLKAQFYPEDTMQVVSQRIANKDS